MDENSGLGGARTHNQRLKMELFAICNMHVISILQMACFLLLRLLLTIKKKRPRRTV
jgi:hypothetical protein